MAEPNAAELRKVMSKPLVKTVDMTAEQSSEAMEIVTMAVDKYASTSNYEVRSVGDAPRVLCVSVAGVLCRLFVASRSCRPLTRSIDNTHGHRTSLLQKAAQLIKDTMDKKFGSTWHVCIGEGFGFEVTYQARNLIFLYYSTKLGILVFKC